MRAFFEPLHARLDVLPGEPDLERDGIPRVFDGVPDVPTFLFVRGEDTKPDTSRPILPGVAAVFDFSSVEVRPVSLPKTESQPARRPWVIDAHLASARRAVDAAEAAVAKESTPAKHQAAAVAKAELVAVERRAAATRLAWAATDTPSASETDPLRSQAAEQARAAVRAEREVAVAKARQRVIEVEDKAYEGSDEDIVKAIRTARNHLNQFLP
jgi:hypothetical protein